MTKLQFILFLTVLISTTIAISCDQPECESSADCPAGYACTDGTCYPMSTDTDADSDMDIDTDIDSDSDGDTDADSDGDSSFQTGWQTDLTGVTKFNQIELPLVKNGVYDFTVNWGDGTENSITSWDDPAKLHTYSNAGQYFVTITGTLVGWAFEDEEANKLINVLNWGEMGFGDTTAQFSECSNLQIDAKDSPDLSGTTSLADTFRNCDAIMSIGENWDTSTIEDMSGTFFNASVFDQDLSGWDTSSVTSMFEMFYSTELFNGDISTWDVSQVTDMGGMFKFSYSFNQDISSWDTSSLVEMDLMFEFAGDFNQDISSWDTSNVTTMANTFSEATVFDQDLSGWDITSVTDMTQMFQNITLSTDNYDALLIGWEGQFPQNDVVFDGGSSQYSALAAKARASLINNYYWTITDGGQN